MQSIILVALLYISNGVITRNACNLTQMLWFTEHFIYFVSLSLFQCYDVIYIQK